MDILPGLFKACVLCLSIFSPSVFSESSTQSTDKVICPTHRGSDPNNVNARVQKLASQEMYYTQDDDYNYKIAICQKNQLDDTAVQQLGRKWKSNVWVTIGRYSGAHVTGGITRETSSIVSVVACQCLRFSDCDDGWLQKKPVEWCSISADWLMIKYLKGDKYHSHCNGVERLAVVLITCDPGVQTGSINIIEEYRNSTKDDEGKIVPLECYYLFELNNDAACSVKAKHLSAGSILLIILIVLGSVYLLLGFLYQRYVAGAKGLEQIPNYDFWRNCGSLQADGCNFMCRCSEAHPTRYKTMDDALADDDRDDTLLPM